MLGEISVALSWIELESHNGIKSIPFQRIAQVPGSPIEARLPTQAQCRRKLPGAQTRLPATRHSCDALAPYSNTLNGSYLTAIQTWKRLCGSIRPLNANSLVETRLSGRLHINRQYWQRGRDLLCSYDSHTRPREVAWSGLNVTLRSGRTAACLWILGGLGPALL
jgi:hypothetical protein